MRSAGPAPGVRCVLPFRRRQTLRAEIDRKLASGGGLDALPQRLPRAGRACDTVPGPDEYPPRPCIRLVIRPRAKVRPGPRFSTSRRQRTQGLCASPATGPGESRRGGSYGGLGTLYSLDAVWIQRPGGAGYAGNRRIVSGIFGLLPVREANGEVARCGLRRDGGVATGAPPPCFAWSPSPSLRDREETRSQAARANLSRLPSRNRSPSAPLGPGLRRDDESGSGVAASHRSLRETIFAWSNGLAVPVAPE